MQAGTIRRVTRRKGSEEPEAARAKARGWAEPPVTAGEVHARQRLPEARSSKVLRLVSLEMENLRKQPRLMLFILSSLFSCNSDFKQLLPAVPRGP